MRSAEILDPSRPQELQALQLFINRGPQFIQEVRAVRERARHKKVKVGSAAIGTSPGGRVGYVVTANQNLHEGPNITKQCAEQRAVKNLRKLGFNLVHFVIVCGTEQPDTQSGLWTPCLHNCGECRCFYRHTPETKNGLIVASVHTQKDGFELYDNSELDAIHSPTRKKEPRFHYFEDPGFGQWEAAGRAEHVVDRVAQEVSHGMALAESLRLALTGRLATQAAHNL